MCTNGIMSSAIASLREYAICSITSSGSAISTITPSFVIPTKTVPPSALAKTQATLVKRLLAHFLRHRNLKLIRQRRYLLFISPLSLIISHYHHAISLSQGEAKMLITNYIIYLSLKLEFRMDFYCNPHDPYSIL